MHGDVEIVFGYGSLMSLHGFFRNFDKHLRRSVLLDIKLIHIPNGLRGFAKPVSSTGKCLRMDIDNYVLEGRLVEPCYIPDEGFVGVGLLVKRDYFPEICAREGFSRELSLKLIDKAQKEQLSVGEYLHKLAKKVSQDGILSTTNVRKYRKILYEELGGTSIHYIPHPLILDNGDVAIIFIAPGRYGTGAGHLSMKAEERIEKLMNAAESYSYCLKRCGNVEDLKKIFDRGVTGWNIWSLSSRYH